VSGTRWLTGDVARRRAAAVVGAVCFGAVVVWAGASWFAFPRELHVPAGTGGVRTAPGGESVPYVLHAESPDDGLLRVPGDRIVMRRTEESQLVG